MPAPRVAVAASGGCDSTALLHCTARQARALGVEVVALHVHHGLMPQADEWLGRVRTQSQRWGVAFDACRLQGGPGSGQSVEAWARRERYRALAQMASAAGCGLVLLAHHRRDQAETWLLQALRGGGPAGLSAMPRCATRQGLVWVRPWLDRPRSDIESYVRQHRLRWVEDGSNANARFARSRLRGAVWPALQTAFPDAELGLAHAALQAQEAAAVLAEVIAQVLPTLLRDGALDVPVWRELPLHRRSLLLRAWLAATLATPVPEALVRRLAVELLPVRAAQWQVGGQTLHLYRGLLQVRVAAQVLDSALGLPVVLNLTQPGRHELPGWGGHLLVQVASKAGVCAADLVGVLARSRMGGEQFQLAQRGALRSLKKQYQARGVPEHQRGGPLLFTAGGELLFAPGLGMDARRQAAPGTAQRTVVWRPDPSGQYLAAD
jgi:tRNA(Ile)-lysidine synthase